MDFYPGGEFETWTAECRNINRGITIIPEVDANDKTKERAEVLAKAASAKSKKKRNNLSNLLTIFASYTPPGTFQTITAEATSLAWIFKRVAKLCNIQIGGRHLVYAWNLAWDKERETPDVFFLRVRSAMAECLMPTGAKYHGDALPAPETFSPLSESLVTLRWLDLIHPRLSYHISENRASLFTSDKPNFADIQPDLCDIMDTLLAELDSVESNSSVTVGEPVQLNRIFSTRRGGSRGKAFRGRSQPAKPWTNRYSTPAIDKQCNHCKVTGKSPGIYQSHDTNDCFDIFPEKRRAAGVRILSVPVHVNEDDEFDPDEAAAFIEAYKLNQG